jgi:hypothetical protein
VFEDPDRSISPKEERGRTSMPGTVPMIDHPTYNALDVGQKSRLTGAVAGVRLTLRRVQKNGHADLGEEHDFAEEEVMSTARRERDLIDDG